MPDVIAVEQVNAFRVPSCISAISAPHVQRFFRTRDCLPAELRIASLVHCLPKANSAHNVLHAWPSMSEMKPVNFANSGGDAHPRRVLMISPTASHPANSGNRARVLSLCDALRTAGHDVHFAYVKRDSPGDEAAMMAYFGNRFHLISYTQPLRRETGARKLLRWTRSLWDAEARHALRIDDWYDESIDAPLAALRDQYAFDAVMVEYVFLSRALELFDSSTIKILDTHDIFANRHRMFLARGLAPEWFSTTEAEEARGLARADFVFAIQAGEIAHFERLGARRVVEVGHILAVQRCYPNPNRAHGADMLFVGGASPINTDAVSHFALQVLPMIRTEIPSARLLIVGGVCERLQDMPGCVLKGRVDDLAQAYSAADLVVNPVRMGTGLNIKSIEALGYGMPLLVSPAGARGLENQSGHALLVAEGPAEFARHACAALRDPRMGKSLSDACWEFVTLGNLRHSATLNTVVAAALPPPSRES
jgi:glycosyltransferase involved in cell wall biosynthesis